MTKKRSKSILKRIQNAVEIIEFAINHEVSVKEASTKCGFSDTYLKNIKAMVYQKFDNGELDINLYKLFHNPFMKYVEMRKSATKKVIYAVTDTKLVHPQISEPNKPRDIPKTDKDSFKQNGDSAEYEWVGSANYPYDHVRTLDQLLAATQVNKKEWNVKDFLINKWDVTSWKSGHAETVQNWQVKARLERDIKLVKERIAGEVFQEMVKGYVPPVLNIDEWRKPETEDEKNLLEISIFDLHIGKLAWGGETGENYDVKIARHRFLTSIETLLKRAQGFNYERILFPVGNDFFNSDTMNNTTTKGTPQDEDLRWQKTFKVGCRLLVDAINMLKQTGVPVDVVVIPGNHDFERSFYLGEYLDSWFSKDAGVIVNNGASPRKYYRYGNVLLGLTHGNEEKESSLPLIMATDIESKPMWSETKFHEWHLAHIHRKRTVQYDINKSRLLNEDLGVTIRYLSSLTGTEEWHHKKGFVGATKAADGFIWNHKFGLSAHLNTNLILD